MTQLNSERQERIREGHASSLMMAALFLFICAVIILGILHGLSSFLHLSHWWFKGEAAVIGITLFFLLRRMYKKNPGNYPVSYWIDTFAYNISNVIDPFSL